MSPVGIQITSFACGGVAIGITIVHALADAQALATFIKDWSATSNSMLEQRPLPKLSPVFDPQALDVTAIGDIDAESPDEAIQAIARKLPCHRYDRYIKVPGQPSWEDLQRPEGYNEAASHQKALAPDSCALPWADWDLQKRCSYRVFHYSPENMASIFAAATSPGDKTKISKHDALIAHVWSCICRARCLSPGQEQFLDHTFGVRQ